MPRRQHHLALAGVVSLLPDFQGNGVVSVQAVIATMTPRTKAIDAGVMRMDTPPLDQVPQIRQASEKDAERRCTTRPLALLLLDDTFAVCRLAGDATVPAWATAHTFFSITRTADELTIVCRQDAVPDG